jgi:PAS domain S-box-containing protein
VDPSPSDSPITQPKRRRHLVGDGRLADYLGVAVFAILIVAVIAAYGLTILSNRGEALDSRRQEVRTVAGLLSRSVETALRVGDLGLARKLVKETSEQYTLTLCKVVLPSGQIIASTDPNGVTQSKVPRRWASLPGQTPTESLTADAITLAYPLTIKGRGSARLEVTTTIPAGAAGGWGTHARFIVIGAVACVIWLAVYLPARKRLRVTGVILGALHDAADPETPLEAMAVSTKLGPEAEAWNNLLSQTQQLRDRNLVEQATATHAPSRQGSGDLDEACNTMSQGLILIDEALNTHYANGAAAAFAGIDRGEMIGKPINQFIEDLSVLDAIREAADGNSRRRSVIEVEKPGQAGPTMLRISVRPVRRGDDAAVMVIVEDITQQRVAEQSRNDFVAQVAHELRAPLSNIRLYVETLLEDGDDPAQRSQSINVINLETKRLTRLVSDMLSVAEIEAGSMQVHLDDIRLDEIFEDLRADYQPQADERHITLTLNMPPKVPVIQADRDKLMMAMHNLLSNAIKYTRDNGKVDVSVEVDDGKFVMEVSDTGIGIGESDIAKIFEKFYRAQDEQLANITGTGLGLSLAREVARLHGGDITVESQHGQGSTFTLTLPTQQHAA